MKGVKIYNRDSISNIVSQRSGETKFGEKIGFLSDSEGLKGHSAEYVLFGNTEDIGVRANMGNAGAAGAWETCLKALLNVQANQYTMPEKLLLLGEVDCSGLMQRASEIEPDDPNYHSRLGGLVTELDGLVTELVQLIIAAGKTPIMVGGGHNNAYGNITGTSLALKKPLNILNIDAHSDLRRTEFRHSGNGFSYARKEGFLGKYRIFGLHKNYTPAYIFEQILQSPNDHFRLFDHLMLKSSQDILKAYLEELDFVSQDDFGLELDCDAIRDFPSSARSPSGFSFNMTRNFIKLAAEEENVRYLHLCEAAPIPSTAAKVGKALSYFITDFINSTK
jgi:formiminoglutamase